MFDFSYVAGQRVKIPDIDDQALAGRFSVEAGETYTPWIRKTLETQAVNISCDVSSAVRMPVLLPVYYISHYDVMAAVNGQTGKVSVRAEKESRYYFLPWWLKAMIATLTFIAICFFSFTLFGLDPHDGMLATGMLAAYFIIVTLCLYSDTVKNKFSIEHGHEIFTSHEKTFHRERGRLVVNDHILERRVAKPVFFSDIEGMKRPIALKFTTFQRVMKIILICTVTMFFPVIIALFINGFDFARLNLGGSAVWFCIAVPTVPIYLLKFGIVELHDQPWIYLIDGKGKEKRYREKLNIDMDVIKTLLLSFVFPPICFAVWFGIISFCVMVYLTAFG